MNEYERQPYGASGMDVLGAWALAAVVFLGVILVVVLFFGVAVVL